MSIHAYDQVVYLLQGGGALGAYQVGVCEALLQYGCHPDWVIGTSIGAINAAIIAGNKPENRIPQLKAFWSKISSSIPVFPIPYENDYWQKSQNFWVALYVSSFGLPGFFKPRSLSPWLFCSGEANQLSYYDTSDLQHTLEEVVDFDLINQKKVRLTLGAVHIKTGKDVHFDNYRERIGPQHIMASGALPPGFPAVKIGNELYWDGGVSSNTPFSLILEEKITERLLCIIINLFALPNQNPSSMMEVLKAKKEFEYASRHQEILHYFLELHLLQNGINILPKPAKMTRKMRAIFKGVADIGHPLSLNIARFHYKDQANNLVSSDFNFYPPVLKQHWECGVRDVKMALKNPKWLTTPVDDTGAFFHEF